MSDINTVKKTVSVVGGGAAGLLAAYFSALNNKEVIIDFKINSISYRG